MKHFYFRFFTILFLFPLLLWSEPTPNEKKIEILIPDGSSGDSDWGKDFLQFEDLDLLGDASEENSKNLFEKAKEDFLKSVDHFRKTIELANLKRKEFDNLNFEADRYEWQKKAAAKILKEPLTET